MPHIHTQTGQHDTTVTAFIVRIDTVQPQALVHMHRKLSILLPVGGHVELDETPWQAISHELQEESGYTLNDLTILQPTSRIKHLEGVVQHPYPVSMNTHLIGLDHFHSDTEYAFVALAVPSKPISNGGSTDIRWLTKVELNNLDKTLINSNIKEIYNFIFDTALESWEQVSATEFTL